MLPEETLRKLANLADSLDSKNEPTLADMATNIIQEAVASDKLVKQAAFKQSEIKELIKGISNGNLLIARQEKEIRAANKECREMKKELKRLRSLLEDNGISAEEKEEALEDAVELAEEAVGQLEDNQTVEATTIAQKVTF